MSIYQTLIGDFLAAEGNSQAKLAEAIGRSQAAVNRYANGIRFPDADTARQIDRATEGRVPFTAWQTEMAKRIGFDDPKRAA